MQGSLQHERREALERAEERKRRLLGRIEEAKGELSRLGGGGKGGGEGEAETAAPEGPQRRKSQGVSAIQKQRKVVQELEDQLAAATADLQAAVRDLEHETRSQLASLTSDE